MNPIQQDEQIIQLEAALDQGAARRKALVREILELARETVYEPEVTPAGINEV